MAYDNQAPGWYLINPEQDGTPPEGAHGTVTKVASRGGGIKEAIMSNMDLIEGAAYAAVPELEMVPAAASGAQEVDAAVTTTESGGDEEEKSPSGTRSTPGGISAVGGKAGAVGSRAAEMRNRMGAAGTVNLSVIDAKVADTNQMVQINAKLGALESQVSSMQNEIKDLQATVARHEAAAGGCNCTIS